MELTCSKCGSTEIMGNVPVVSNVDNLSSVPVSALAYSRPEAMLFKGPVPHRFVARICGGCGFTEFYVENPQGLLATVTKSVVAS